jgi:hypothetical protein
LAIEKKPCWRRIWPVPRHWAHAVGLVPASAPLPPYYNALDAGHQAYFWSLTPRQMTGYWALTADQRERVYAMTPAARTSAWASIEAQLAAGANNSATSVAARTNGEVPAQTANQANARTVDRPATTTVVTDGTPATPAVIARNNPGNLAAPPASALSKSYPVCRGAIQDSCQNAGEGGAPGRSRALPYWPGEPASERDADVGG